MVNFHFEYFLVIDIDQVNWESFEFCLFEDKKL